MDVDIPDEEVLDAVDLNVPDIASKDPEERKLARRIRLKRREEAVSRLQAFSGTDDAVPEKEKEKPRLLQLQLEKSGATLNQLFLESIEQVTNIRVANDTREVDRRELEGLGREKVTEKLEEEVRLASQMFDEISNHWADVLKYNDPLAIHEELISQKEKCAELVAQKDSVIAMLKNEVTMAEAKFFQDQKMMNDDISMLAKRVEKQVSSVRTAHRNELQAINDVMIQERGNMMDNSDTRWGELYKRREEQELAISENKILQRAEFEEVVTKVRVKHYENIREVKIRLERDFEILQQEFEEIRAISLANSEKMDYNYQLLKKREGENIIIKSNQKRKLNKLRDVINSLRDKHKDYKTTTENELHKLYTDVLTLQKFITGVRTKSDNMSAINEKRYMEVWELNERTATKIFKKLLTIDKLLHEQQLGLPWAEPTMKLLKKKELPSYVEAVTFMESLKPKSVLSKSTPSDGRTFDDSNANAAYRRVVKQILEMISTRSGFLIEKRINLILKPLSKDENVLVKVDNVFTALGITNSMDINILSKFFRPYIKCPICAMRRGVPDENEMRYISEISVKPVVNYEAEEEKEAYDLKAVREPDAVIDSILTNMVPPERLEDFKPEISQKEGECLGPVIDEPTNEQILEGQSAAYLQVVQTDATDVCQSNHPLTIEPGCILRAVREFVSYYFCGITDDSGNKGNQSRASGMGQKSPTVSRLMSPMEVSEFWKRYQIILGEDKLRLWDALQYALQKYLHILEDRHNLNIKLTRLRRQNKELKHLLAKYKEDDIASKKPPCAIQREIPIHGDALTCIPKRKK